MSNWERRPLRLTQQHYAALDAYILVRMITKLAEKGQEVGKPIQQHIKVLDKKDYKAPEGDNSDEEVNMEVARQEGGAGVAPMQKHKSWGAQ